MKLKLLLDDLRGAVLIEYTITLPLFIMVTFGLIEAGLLLWTQAGLQHGVELAARCATVNSATNSTSCNNSPTCAADDIPCVAANQSLGVIPIPAKSIFKVNQGACGNLVTVSYTFDFIGLYFLKTTSVTLTAQSCYPSYPS